MGEETVKSQLRVVLSLFEDISETVSRCEEHLTNIENSASHPGTPDASSQILVQDAQDLRATIISLKQQLLSSITTDLEPLKGTLTYLHREGIPELTDQVRDLSEALATFQKSLPMLTTAMANIAPMKTDVEEAGKFARHFYEPMRELLGRTPTGSYDEGKFILRNLARSVFSLTGKDDVGKDSAKNKLEAFLDHYFEQNHLLSSGAKKEGLFKFWDSLVSYAQSMIWHRLFDVLIALIIWLMVLNPAAKALKSIQDLSATLKPAPVVVQPVVPKP